MTDTVQELIEFRLVFPTNAYKRGLSPAFGVVKQSGFTEVAATLSSEVRSRDAVDTTAFMWMRPEVVNESYRLALQACRRVQTTDSNTGVLAQYVRGIARANEHGATTVDVLGRDSIPFSSKCSAVRIGLAEPMHPANSNKSEIEDATESIDDVAHTLVMDPQRLFQMSPSDFEMLVADLYRAQGFDVHLNAGPRDHGIDISASLTAPLTLPGSMQQRFTIGIQAKRYAVDNKIGEAILREFYGSIAAAGLDRGVLVTTSSLTAPAQEFVSSRRPVSDRIMVLAGDNILELVIAYCRNRGLPFWNSIR